MTKKPLLFIALAALLAGLLVYVNRDWFRRPVIQISHRFYAFGGRFDNEGGTAPLLFEFSRMLKLTSVKVIPVSDLETNKHPHAIWELTTDSGSTPTKGFLYGMEVPGMHPAVKGAVADRLDPSAQYRLLIEAGSLKAQHDFSLLPASP